MIKCAIIALLLYSQLHAQPDSLWGTAYGGRHVDECWAVIQTSDGGFALGGVFDGFVDEIRDEFYLVKTDDAGIEQWSETYGTDGTDNCYSLMETLDHGYLMVGVSSSLQGLGGYAIRVDSVGGVLWENLYDGAYKLYTVTSNEDDGFIMAGMANHIWDFHVIKIDGDGEEVWSRRYGGDGSETCYSIISTGDGGYLLTGFTTSFGAGGQDMYAVKIDEDGEEIWSNTYGTEVSEWGYDASQTDDGGFGLCGFQRGEGLHPVDVLLVRIDSEGEELWTATYGGDMNDSGHAIVSAAGGGFAIGGFTMSFRRRAWDNFYLVRVDSEGEELWSTVFGTRYEDQCFDLLQVDDGGFVLAGKVSFEIDEDDGFFDEPNMGLVKTSPDPNDVPTLLDPAFPSEFAVQPAYPNPFNSNTTIRYQLPQSQPVTMRIYDVHGREVTTLLVNKQLQAGSHQMVWNATNQPAGQYFVTLKADENVSVRNVVLVK